MKWGSQNASWVLWGCEMLLMGLSGKLATVWSDGSVDLNDENGEYNGL